MKLTGRVVKGKFLPDLPAAWPIAMREFDGKEVELEINQKRVRRSNRANARHWAVIVPLARHALNLKRPDLIPLSAEQTHYALVAAFGACEETDLGPVPVRSSLMDKKQFHALDEKAELWLRDQGYEIPDGPEVSVAQAIEEATA